MEEIFLMTHEYCELSSYIAVLAGVMALSSVTTLVLALFIYKVTKQNKTVSKD